MYCHIAFPSTPAVDAGLIGLSLTYTISLATLLQHGVRMAAEVESLVSKYMHPLMFLCLAE